MLRAIAVGLHLVTVPAMHRMKSFARSRQACGPRLLCWTSSVGVLGLTHADRVTACAQGFKDDAYKRRRVAIANLAREHEV